MSQYHQKKTLTNSLSLWASYDIFNEFSAFTADRRIVPVSMSDPTVFFFHKLSTLGHDLIIITDSHIHMT